MIEERDISICASDLILAADGNLSRELAMRFAHHAAMSFGLKVRRAVIPDLPRVTTQPVKPNYRAYGFKSQAEMDAAFENRVDR